MPDIPRDFPDLALDAIVSALAAFSASQSAPVRFQVSRDRTRLPHQGELPHVNVCLDTDNPEEGHSASRTHLQATVTVNCDCIAKAGEGATPSDEAAASRLHYLRAQVRHGLYKLINADLGFAPGVLARKAWPRWTAFQKDDGFPEEQIVGGRWTLEIEYAWTPEEIDLTPLTSITVGDDTADMWAVEFDLPGGDT